MAIKLQAENIEHAGDIILQGLEDLWGMANIDGIAGLSEDEYLAFVTVLDED